MENNSEEILNISSWKEIPIIIIPEKDNITGITIKTTIGDLIEVFKVAKGITEYSSLIIYFFRNGLKGK